MTDAKKQSDGTNGQYEKVEKGLEICTESTEYGGCITCPYHADYYPNTCRYANKKDALALIQQQQERIAELEAAQTARVMTLEELDAIYQTKERHTWPFNTPPYLWMIVNPDVRQTRGFWICWRDITYSLENDSPFYVRENYGKVWKIWTAEPTDEQMEATPWKN